MTLLILLYNSILALTILVLKYAHTSTHTRAHTHMHTHIYSLPQRESEYLKNVLIYLAGMSAYFLHAYIVQW